MINRAITSTTIKGQIALVNASSERLLMLQATNRHAPTGGVINARLRESTMIIPKWIGSIPKLLTAIGWRIGPRIIKAAAISINIPTISIRTRMRSKMICGLLLTLKKPAATVSGTRSMVRIQPRIEADPIIRNTTPVVLPV